MATALLDLDGTLIDSGPVIFNAARHALGTLGLPVPADMRPFVGPPLPDGMRRVLGVPDDRVEEAISIYRAHQFDHLGDSPVYEGVLEACDELRARGWALAVATSKREDLARRTMDVLGLTPAFDVIAGGDEVSCAKDVVIGRALDRLGAKGLGNHGGPIMVGDRYHDIEGARSHGIPAVFAAWGYGTRAEGAYADAVVELPADLVGTLVGLADGR
ncbi:MAG TPA: HAD hydrolase-like protein [Actinomycetaceae bacterium]|nr:HAD hydrolase-like protein [Actinomycetaceae bacterium]